ncbi:MAG: TetR/AcrR family transcriptional regulator [Alphaproteobacteria bacterium]|nr:TetR/AcrR family transcriptional regulator [Alphaproteobacteria bacterium]
MPKLSQPRTKPDFREKLRKKVLQIGRNLIEQEGLEAVQARRIAKQAKCAVGSIYNIYSDLDDLIIALNMITLAELGETLRHAHAASAGKSTHDRLLALAEAYFDFAAARRKHWRAIFEHILPEGRTAPPDYRSDQDRLFALVEEILDAEIDEPEQRASAARALFASVHGIVSLSLDRKLGEFEPQATRRQIKFLIGCMSKGLNVD